ncbi:hypothetical protein [Antrihabitans cavernicola]|uniref:Uncharacterized protein n=1 Tax=Antrihabitans cavernicola TaxID=2495913 RepID=A0A5A7SD05_9NOCA|nr:hypothetical protein [Spelaeibacter cavernicola]KAA0022607.1 hypothetical protein FOY51_13020 [Spelaeibacter cavernicola]
MKITLIRTLGIAAAASSIALLGAGTAVAAPVGVSPTPSCPNPLPYGQATCTVSPDKLSVTSQYYADTVTYNYDRLGNYVCASRPNVIGYAIHDIPCNAAVAAVHALPPLPIGDWFPSASQ